MQRTRVLFKKQHRHKQRVGGLILGGDAMIGGGGTLQKRSQLTMRLSPTSMQRAKQRTRVLFKKQHRHKQRVGGLTLGGDAMIGGGGTLQRASQQAMRLSPTSMQRLKRR